MLTDAFVRSAAAAAAHASLGANTMADEAQELERVAQQQRRARGGTPALFRSLAGALGNYGAGDGASPKPGVKPPLLVSAFNIPRSNLLVHVRRMRLAYLGLNRAARVDKRVESRSDRSTHAGTQSLGARGVGSCYLHL